MKDVATMTPDPKYLTAENTHSGTPVRFEREVSGEEERRPHPRQAHPAETHVSAVTA